MLRRKAGPQAPAFDPAVVEQLQQEVAGEADALPLLAFVLQRLMREHQGAATIGVAELEHTGGVAAAIEREAEAALADAGYGPDRVERRDVLRRLFIPRLARIDRESKAPQRRVARQSELPADLATLARALTERRLLVARVASEVERGETGAATLEVAHEALLRRWPTLADLLAEDRDALLMLDGVVMAANDWEKADAGHKQDFLAHRGSRLVDAQALPTRGEDWARHVAPAAGYLAACAEREAAERAEKEAALAREQARLSEIAAAQARTAHLQRRGRWTLAGLAAIVALGLGVGMWQYRTNLERQAQLDQGQATLLAELATSQRLQGRLDSAFRLSVHAARLELRLGTRSAATALARAALAAVIWQSHWRTVLAGHEDVIGSAAFSPDGARIVTASDDRTARLWDAATGKEIAVLRGHEGYVRSAAFSPDGARIVTASDDDRAAVGRRDRQGDRRAARPRGSVCDPSRSAPTAPASSPRHRTGPRGVWDAATGKEIAVLRGHEDSVYSAAFSPDGARIVTASVDRTARRVGRRDRQGDRGAARPRGLGVFRRLQPRRRPHRHCVRRRDRAAVGRRDRQGDRGAARPRGICGVRRVQPRRRRASSPRQPTRPRGCGTPRPARRSRCCAATSRLCDPSRSAPTARASSPRHLTRPRGCGTPRPARRSRCCAGTRTG